MIKRRPYHCLVASISALCFLVGLGIAPPPASALDLGGILGDVVKVAGIGFLVKQFGHDIDGFINSVLSQKGIEHEAMTKVVPILRIGSGTAVGAAQVVGPPIQVRKVQAVAELEISLGRSLRARALMPITTKSFATSTLRGVGGVGVSANLKLRI